MEYVGPHLTARERKVYDTLLFICPVIFLALMIGRSCTSAYRQEKYYVNQCLLALNKDYVLKVSSIEAYGVVALRVGTPDYYTYRSYKALKELDYYEVDCLASMYRNSK